eukprot:scaffold223467_cov49-Prasinocladus_malaysianus.AAC.4
MTEQPTDQSRSAALRKSPPGSVSSKGGPQQAPRNPKVFCMPNRCCKVPTSHLAFHQLHPELRGLFCRASMSWSQGKPAARGRCDGGATLYRTSTIP